MPDRTSGATNSAIVLLSLAVVAAIVVAGPFATQDGPVHLTFGHFLGLDRDTHPLLVQHYRTNDTLNPNSAVYFLIAFLLRAFSPSGAESVVQVLCTLGVVASAWFALRQVSSESDKTWLTLLAFPVSLSRLLFFGTYNFCFSVAGVLLVIGTFLRLQKRVTAGRALAVVAALYFAFFAHGAGFIAAGLAGAALAAAQVVASLRAGESLGAIVRAQRVNALVLVSPLPLVLLALGGSEGGGVAYRVELTDRLLNLAFLDSLRVHPGAGKALATLVLNPVLWGGVAALAVSVWLRRGELSRTRQRDGAIGALAVFAAMVLLALTFPDRFGGGWIHFQRMALFPYLGAMLCLAYCPMPRRAQAAIASIAVIVTVALLTDAVTAQRGIARQMQPLAEVDRLVGSHCSVLPLVISLKPLEANGRPVNLGYNPYLHVGTRLEFDRDRVSLFNYQARTALYPVRFQDGHDTQALIFGWPPRREAIGISTVDVERFESASGTAVDYILQWGPLSAATPDLRQQVLQAEQGAERVYESGDGRVALFRRRTGARSQCAG